MKRNDPDAIDIRKIRGDFGEKAVCDYLAKKGYEIVKTNYKKLGGEIDIIALFMGEIIFVEVKTRKLGSLGTGLDAITRDKRRKIINTANKFVDENPVFYNTNARFDVARVVVTIDNPPKLIEIEYYEDAFNSALL